LGYYCRPETIFNEALEGRGDFRICPLDKRESLRIYYQVANDYYQANSEFDRSQNDINYYLKELERKDLSVKDHDDYRKRLYDLRINSSRVQSRYQDAVRNLERFKAERGLR
jgi:intergrase/recombinase